MAGALEGLEGVPVVRLCVLHRGGLGLPLLRRLPPLMMTINPPPPCACGVRLAAHLVLHHRQHLLRL